MTADFAASAAMAKDILAIGVDSEEVGPPPPRNSTPSAVAVAPRPVPDLDKPDDVSDWSAQLPMAPDFFTSSRAKPKKKLWKISR